MAEIEVRVRTWVKGSDEDQRSGLLGFLSVQYGTLVLDGLTLRRTASGKLAISFPARTDRSGRKHPLIRPADDAARTEIEDELLWQLGEREDFAA